MPDTDEIALPCAPESEAFERATRELETLGQRIEQLAPTDDPEPHRSALLELVAGECFELYGVVDWYRNDAALSSGLALRTWWEDGGDVWIKQFLTPEMTWERPSVRMAFAPELVPDHPLADLFCPLADLDCDVRTRGWKQRANHAFEVHAEYRWTQYKSNDEPLPVVRDWSRCEELAVNEPSHLRYTTWIGCIDHVTLRQSVFPIGGLRAPDEGWFVVRGHRGDCSEIRVLDLATGSVHAVASCSGLLQETSGRVPVDALREAVWMALWSTEMSDLSDQLLGGQGYPLPETIEPIGRATRFGLMGRTGSSGQTTLDWTYVRDDRPSVSGSLRWPEDYNDGAKDHAVRLLQIAEAAMVVGCVSARVPKISFDANAETLSETQRELERALASMKAPRCGRG